MTRKNTMGMILVIYWMIHIPPAIAADPSIKFTCSNGDLTRIVEGWFSHGGSAPCKVIYKKIDEEPNISQTLWGAKYSSQYCTNKLHAFIEKQKVWGFTCQSTEGSTVRPERNSFIWDAENDYSGWPATLRDAVEEYFLQYFSDDGDDGYIYISEELNQEDIDDDGLIDAAFIYSTSPPGGFHIEFNSIAFRNIGNKYQFAADESISSKYEVSPTGMSRIASKRINEGEERSPVPDTPRMVSAGDFSAMLLITNDPDGFFEQWNRPPSPDYKPSMSTVTTAKHGDVVGAIILFSGCRADHAGNCNSEVDFKVYKPDGSLESEHSGGELWSNKPAIPEGTLQVSISNLVFEVELDDQLGEHRIEAIVRDLNAKEYIELLRTINIEAKSDKGS
jgi:hypothetical protein